VKSLVNPNNDNLLFQEAIGNERKASRIRRVLHPMSSDRKVYEMGSLTCGNKDRKATIGEFQHFFMHVHGLTTRQDELKTHLKYMEENNLIFLTVEIIHNQRFVFYNATEKLIELVDTRNRLKEAKNAFCLLPSFRDLFA
jgi:hypothetical protein